MFAHINLDAGSWPLTVPHSEMPLALSSCHGMMGDPAAHRQ
jgi:hypothetical protein